MSDCLHCGKPLGTRSLLCYACEADGLSPDDIGDADAVDTAVLERVERYFIVAAVKCPDCEEPHGRVTVDGEQYTAADFGIESLEEWRTELDAEESWMREHRRAVEATLPVLAAAWPQSVATLRTTVLSARHR